jgi:hypothetical protein
MYGDCLVITVKILSISSDNIQCTHFGFAFFTFANIFLLDPHHAVLRYGVYSVLLTQHCKALTTF